MVNESRSWIMWGIALASAGLGAWWLMEGEPAPSHPPLPVGAESVRPAPPPAAIASAPVIVAPASSASAAAPAPAPDRFRLVGVMAQAGEGMAMIALDGQPARTFRVGDAVMGDLVLRQVSAQGAVIAPRESGAAISLQYRPLSQPAASPTPAGGDAEPGQNLADGSIESERKLREVGARHLPIAPPAAADAASAAAPDAAPPADEGRWRPVGQP